MKNPRVTRRYRTISTVLYEPDLSPFERACQQEGLTLSQAMKEAVQDWVAKILDAETERLRA